MNIVENGTTTVAARPLGGNSLTGRWGPSTNIQKSARPAP